MPWCKARSSRKSLLDFFRDGFLDRIEKERDFGRDRGRKANAWIFRFNEPGTAVPVFRAFGSLGGPYLDSTYDRDWQCGAA